METISPPTYLVGHDLILEAYGYWPSFHDAEVISIKLDRTQILFGPIRNARIELTIHCFEITKEFDPTKHNLITFEFEEVGDVSLAGFNHQNAIFDMYFDELPLEKSGNHSFKVTLIPAFGVEGRFKASKGRVVSLFPCDAEGDLLQAL